jgi:MFS transporter, DHA1 family, putative efflux transporter
MNNTWKIYMLTLISFFVGTSQFGIVGMLDKIAHSVGVTVPTAGQLVTGYCYLLQPSPPSGYQ